MTDAATVSQIPETSWLWRRVITFGVLIVAHALVGFAVWWLKDAASLKWICIALIAECVIAETIYLTAATMTEWAKLAASVSGALKVNLFGVSSPATPAARVEQDPDK